MVMSWQRQLWCSRCLRPHKWPGRSLRQPTSTRQESPPAYVGLAVSTLSSTERERAFGLHAKGIEQLKRGNVYAARKFFERAIEDGLAQSALMLAGTYDPDELAKMEVVGLQPDID